jgi:hypothetical protein
VLDDLRDVARTRALAVGGTAQLLLLSDALLHVARELWGAHGVAGFVVA